MKAKRVEESLNQMFKPKTADEIAVNLDFVESIDDLIVDQDYIIKDHGMDKWMNALTYKGKQISRETGDYVYTFESSLQFDDFKLEFTEEELDLSIGNNDIAVDNTGFSDIL